MRLLNNNELYESSKKENCEGLWVFIDSEKSNFINNEDKNEIKNWIKLINAQHHNDMHFFSRLKEIFTEEGKCYLIEGQEDKGAIEFNNSVVIVRNSEFGVALNVVQMDGSDVDENNWSNYQKILSGLKLGFINPKDFHLMKNFDNLNNELQINSSTTNKKAKI